MIVERKNLDFNQERIVFGSYALVYTGTSNNTRRRIIPSIALNKSKYHGGQYLMSLYTGKRLHSYEWTDLPIENDVIEQVKKFYSDEKRPLLKDKYPICNGRQSYPL